MSAILKLEERVPSEKTFHPPSSPPPPVQKWPASFVAIMLLELKVQRKIALPLVAMNLAWFAKLAITTAF